jgi:hypothetical protein
MSKRDIHFLELSALELNLLLHVIGTDVGCGYYKEEGSATKAEAALTCILSSLLSPLCHTSLSLH